MCPSILHWDIEIFKDVDNLKKFHADKQVESQYFMTIQIMMTPSVICAANNGCEGETVVRIWATLWGKFYIKTTFFMPAILMEAFIE